jgi:hypothetical protein
VLVVAEDQALVSWAVMTQMRSYPLVLVGPSRRVRPRSRGKNVWCRSAWRGARSPPALPAVGPSGRRFPAPHPVGRRRSRAVQGYSPYSGGEVDQDVVNVDVEDLHSDGSSLLVWPMAARHSHAPQSRATITRPGHPSAAAVTERARCGQCRLTAPISIAVIKNQAGLQPVGETSGNQSIRVPQPGQGPSPARGGQGSVPTRCP